MRYWKITSHDQRRGIERWQVNPEWELPNGWPLRTGKPLDPAQRLPEYRVICPRTSTLDDLPWCIGGTLITSPRIRAFFEEWVPNDCEFVPVTMLWEDTHETAVEGYSILVITKLIDCMDTARSMNEDEDGQFVEQLVIDPSRVPENVKLFRPKGFHVVPLLREDICHELDALNVSGLKFFGVWHSTDEHAPNATWKPGKRRR